MSFTRIIPRLDIKGPNLVKGIHLEGLQVLGKPEHFAQYYYENGADDQVLRYMRKSLTTEQVIKGIEATLSAKQFEKLYLERDANFRGFRQS